MGKWGVKLLVIGALVLVFFVVTSALILAYTDPAYTQSRLERMALFVLIYTVEPLVMAIIVLITPTLAEWLYEGFGGAEKTQMIKRLRDERDALRDRRACEAAAARYYREEQTTHA